MNNKPIGVFDSGIGGLTVLKEIMKITPNENIVYITQIPIMCHMELNQKKK